MNAEPAISSPAPATPLAWRVGIALAIVGLFGVAYLLPDDQRRGRAVCGVLCFIGVAALCSTNLRAVNWRTVGTGIGLQIVLAGLVLHVPIVRAFFDTIGGIITQFIGFTDKGAQFVFGKLADPGAEGGLGFVFAFKALPPIIFVSSFFTVLYFLGVLQFIVKLLARAMTFIMGTSGGETLSAVANVFMGQTEAPLIVKPYVPKMTKSELLALMVGGMATVSGGIMAGLLSMFPEDKRQELAVAILTTGVMAAPCGLYLSKLILPETEESETRGVVKAADERIHTNIIDAASAGASDGMSLAINVAAMLIAFLAFIALIDAVLAQSYIALFKPTDLKDPAIWSLQNIFSTLFWPAAYLLGVPRQDIPAVADLLGIKLAANEFVAFLKLSNEYQKTVTPVSFQLSAFALTSFANFASIGIQLGGIGAMAPTRRQDLARLGGLALVAGFLATLVNAAVASVLM
jgi:CNT family concentrative nucleoside transporter